MTDVGLGRAGKDVVILVLVESGIVTCLLRNFLPIRRRLRRLPTPCSCSAFVCSLSSLRDVKADTRACFDRRMREREEADVKRLYTTAAFVTRSGCEWNCLAVHECDKNSR